MRYLLVVLLCVVGCQTEPVECATLVEDFYANCADAVVSIESFQCSEECFDALVHASCDDFKRVVSEVCR